MRVIYGKVKEGVIFPNNADSKTMLPVMDVLRKKHPVLKYSSRHIT